MPRPASLRDIIRQHPRERLLVQPLEWTARHLELLHCSFEEEKLEEGDPEKEEVLDNNGEDVQVPDANEPGKKKPVDRWARTAERLATYEMKTAAMKKLLAERDGPLKFLRPFGYFCFGFEHEFRLHGAVFAERAPGTQAPIFAFMQRGMIKIQREGVFSLPRPRRPNPPAELIRKLRLKQLEPSDPWCDPYILAVLVGLAQSQAQSRSLEKDLDGKGRPDAFKVCAVLVDETNTDTMGFYTATISTEFLSKFEYPDGLKPTKVTLSSSLRIKHKKMAFQPYSNLRERLIEAMSPCFEDAKASQE
ncbi:hypothetical protein NW759_006841 [Fusarium solani]|nr:hypothetical protein NW759_006841 [Fusarium solani]